MGKKTHVVTPPTNPKPWGCAVTPAQCGASVSGHHAQKPAGKDLRDVRCIASLRQGCIYLETGVQAEKSHRNWTSAPFSAASDHFRHFGKMFMCLFPPVPHLWITLRNWEDANSLTDLCCKVQFRYRLPRNRHCFLGQPHEVSWKVSQVIHNLQVVMAKPERLQQHLCMWIVDEVSISKMWVCI